MPSLPDGDPAPTDGRLPASAALGALGRRFGVYVHVPFCVRRCGYCDFNTYTPAELHSGATTLADTYLQAVDREMELAARVLADLDAPRPVSTVFLGGGTPTMLKPDQLTDLLARIRTTWGLIPDAEVTTEANPDSVTAESLQQLAAGGFTRVSFGMQSSVRHVLATLERTHDPDRVPIAVEWARAAGLQVSLDLIYGTPGESLDDWRASLQAALASTPEHVSAYSLTVEPGTALAAQVRRGAVPAPDPDDQAAKYELADDLLTAAGYQWYEISNWARGDTVEAARPRQCLHNIGYWRGDDWWGVGPGAHSHVGGVRWWNVKHPTAYASRLADGRSPALGREVLSAGDRRLEHVMLGIRLRAGLEAAGLDRRVVADLAREGLLAHTDPLVLTRRGRLLADHVTRELAG